MNAHNVYDQLRPAGPKSTRLLTLVATLAERLLTPEKSNDGIRANLEAPYQRLELIAHEIVRFKLMHRMRHDFDLAKPCQCNNPIHFFSPNTLRQIKEIIWKTVFPL